MHPLDVRTLERDRDGLPNDAPALGNEESHSLPKTLVRRIPSRLFQAAATARWLFGFARCRRWTILSGDVVTIKRLEKQTSSDPTSRNLDPLRTKARYDRGDDCDSRRKHPRPCFWDVDLVCEFGSSQR